MSAMHLGSNGAPRLFGLRRGTWIGLGLSLLVLAGLSIWAVVSVAAWLFGKVPEATEAGRQAAGVAIEKAEQVLPGIREQVGVWMPGAAKGEPAATSAAGTVRDVSGSDLGPVARYPGLSREHFIDDGARTAVRFGGGADYPAVLAHYAEGFKAAGYSQGVLSATRTGEHHRYSGERDQFELRITGQSEGRVEVEIRRVP
jgi:hypothetical protein